jgi:hypothetical protein
MRLASRQIPIKAAIDFRCREKFMHYDPYTEHTEEQREAIASAMFGLQLWLEDRRGYFTWMWLIGAGFIGWALYKSLAESGWVNANGWQAAFNYIGGVVLLIAGVALRVNAALEMRYLRRMERIAVRRSL